jgi:hypothetical protein
MSTNAWMCDRILSWRIMCRKHDSSRVSYEGMQEVVAEAGNSSKEGNSSCHRREEGPCGTGYAKTEALQRLEVSVNPQSCQAIPLSFAFPAALHFCTNLLLHIFMLSY